MFWNWKLWVCQTDISEFDKSLVFLSCPLFSSKWIIAVWRCTCFNNGFINVVRYWVCLRTLILHIHHIHLKERQIKLFQKSNSLSLFLKQPQWGAGGSPLCQGWSVWLLLLLLVSSVAMRCIGCRGIHRKNVSATNQRQGCHWRARAG